MLQVKYMESGKSLRLDGLGWIITLEIERCYSRSRIRV
jgi:hypothetical protein